MASQSQPPFKQVPLDWKEWTDAAKAAGVYQASVHNRKEFASGSKISKDEYLLLRVIWPEATPNAQHCIDDLGLQSLFDKARAWLDSFQPFQRYLDAVENSTTPGDPDLGIFDVAHAQQHQANRLLHQPGGGEGLQSGINEDIVNAAFISFLTGICLRHTEVNASWTPRRASLTAAFRNSTLECQVDGILLSGATGATQVIVEVKPKARKFHEPQVSMQEAAEMVAAITAGPPKGLAKEKAILISQDGDELYLAKGSCNAKYRRYMQDRAKRPTKTDFLEIQRYGPFKVTQRQGLRQYAALVLAIALQASEDED